MTKESSDTMRFLSHGNQSLNDGSYGLQWNVDAVDTLKVLKELCLPSQPPPPLPPPALPGVFKCLSIYLINLI